MTVLRCGVTPKMKPVSPKRAAVVAGLDIGTSKVVCLIARLEPQAPQDVLRRRSHGVRLLAFAHTAALVGRRINEVHARRTRCSAFLAYWLFS